MLSNWIFFGSSGAKVPTDFRSNNINGPVNFLQEYWYSYISTGHSYTFIVIIIPLTASICKVAKGQLDHYITRYNYLYRVIAFISFTLQFYPPFRFQNLVTRRII